MALGEQRRAALARRQLHKGQGASGWSGMYHRGARARQEPHHAGLVPGSVTTVTGLAPRRTPSLLGLGLEENRAQISWGLRSDGLFPGTEV